MAPIFVWWIGEAPGDPALLAGVARHLASALGAPAAIWESPERPRHAYDPRRRQHSSAAILKWLLQAGPGGGKVLGITDQDLFIPILTYVFGEAQLDGAAAVVSTARLVAGQDPAARRLLAERLAKEAVHEVGHALGLLHCGSLGCVMSRSAGVHDVDAKDPEPCGACRARLAERQDQRS